MYVRGDRNAKRDVAEKIRDPQKFSMTMFGKKD